MASVLTFLRTQGSLILMGMLLIGGIITQIQSARRYHKLRKEIASAAIRPALDEREGCAESKEFLGQASRQQEGSRIEPKRAMRGVRYQRAAEEAGDALDCQEEAPVSAGKASAGKTDGRMEGVRTVSGRHTASKRGSGELPETDEVDEIDSGLLQLKQSLERIAVSRDQKAEEQLHRGRVLTPAEQKVIADILSEYLA